MFLYISTADDLLIMFVDKNGIWPKYKKGYDKREKPKYIVELKK